MRIHFRYPTPPLVIMATARVLVGLVGLSALLYTFTKSPNYKGLEWSTGVYMFTLIMTESLELVIKSGHAPLPETPITVFVVLLYYLFLPPSIWQSIIAASAGTIAYLLTLVFLPEASSGHITNTALIFFLANGFGLYFCVRYGTAQRREYLALAQLKRQAELDSLTGIYNRRKIMELATREFSSAQRYEYPCSILMLDIDHFKAVNDTYGHSAGDAVLTGFSDRCAGLLRNADLFGRIGGEEFLIVMPHCSGERASVAAERLITAVRTEPFRANGSAINATISIGIAELSPDSETPDAILQKADLALYRSKQNGRDRSSVYTDDE